MRATRFLAWVVVVMAAIPVSVFAAAPEQRTNADIYRATPANQLPTTEERYRALQQQMQSAKPRVKTARERSEELAAQAAQLQRQLVATAGQVQSLEREKAKIDADILTLAAREKALSDKFARDRVKVSELIAVLERLQSDLPPALALEPADALRSARGAMLLGGALPRIYDAAARLVRQLKTLRQTRAALLIRRSQSVRNAAELALAQSRLDRLLAAKQQQASGASAEYRAVQAQLDTIARRATDLKSLLDRVAALRTSRDPKGIVVVSAESRSFKGVLRPGSLVPPVAGQVILGVPGREGMPGLNFATSSGASVVAPSDSHVLFAGPYRETGQVLILEAAGGYDLVLAGLGRLDVRAGDQLLAGEPVGRMPHRRNGAELYFELRQNGRSISPAIWLGLGLRKAKRS